MKLTLKLKLIAMDTVTDILTTGLDRDNIREHLPLSELTEAQQREVVDMVRGLLLALLDTDENKMLKILEKY